MLPVLALVGRPNVGKSTLFNQLTRTRNALVADVPGLTRDRHYGRAVLGGHACVVVDTGGMFGPEDALQPVMERQVTQALDEADAIMFVVDARAGLHPSDDDVVKRLRRAGKPVWLLVNKVDGVAPDGLEGEFAALGIADYSLVSASHGRGIGAFIEAFVDAMVGAGVFAAEASGGVAQLSADGVRVAVVGRPNVGKSTLINRLIGEERQVVFDAPGTTRDAIDVPFERDGRQYVLVDTAGVRRKGRVDAAIEKFSVVKTLAAIEAAQVAIVVMDAREGIVEQDLHVVHYVLDGGCAAIVALNKWDGLEDAAREKAQRDVARKLRFAPWLPVRRVSALHGTGVGGLFDAVDAAVEESEFDVPTSAVTRVLEALVARHPPPAVRGRAVKLRFAHKTGGHPPHVVVHGNQTDTIPDSYVRYLENGFREAFDLGATPVRVTFRKNENPFAGRRNELTRRQRLHRRRVIRHRKSRKSK